MGILKKFFNKLREIEMEYVAEGEHSLDEDLNDICEDIFDEISNNDHDISESLEDLFDNNEHHLGGDKK